MESMREIQARVQSIKGTRQITQSMQLVSTAKLQRVQSRLNENRPFFENAEKIIKNVISGLESYKHPYITGRMPANSLIILVTCDRGLCGGYNINVQKEAMALADKSFGAQIITVGTKGRDYCLRRKKNVIHTFHGISEKPFYDDAANIGDIALRMYNKKEVDEVHLVYTKYKSMMLQEPSSIRLLPLPGSLVEGSKTNKKRVIYFEQGIESLFENSVSLYVHSMLFRALLEASVSEQCSRMTSMSAAVKNSNNMIDALTLLYNQIRQGSITQEISEIVGGANALMEKEGKE